MINNTQENHTQSHQHIKVAFISYRLYWNALHCTGVIMLPCPIYAKTFWKSLSSQELYTGCLLSTFSFSLLYVELVTVSITISYRCILTMGTGWGVDECVWSKPWCLTKVCTTKNFVPVLSVPTSPHLPVQSKLTWLLSLPFQLETQ